MQRASRSSRPGGVKSRTSPDQVVTSLAFRTSPFLFLVLICLFLWSGVAVPLAVPDNDPEQEALVVAQDHAWPPFAWEDDSGQPRGLLVELWQQVGEALGRPVRFHLSDWPESLRAVDDGVAHVHGGLLVTPEREGFLSFGESLLPLSTTIFVPSTMPVLSVEDLENESVGVVRGSREARFLIDEHPGLLHESYENNAAMVRAAVRGDIQVFVADYPVAMFLLGREGANLDFRPLGLLYQEPLRFAVRQGDEELLSALNAAVRGLPQGELDRLSQRWLHSERIEVFPTLPVVAAGAGLLFLLLLFLILTLQRQRRVLRSSVQARTQELEAARKAQEASLRYFQQLTASVPGVLFCYRLNLESGKHCYPFISRRVKDVLGLDPDELRRDASPVFDLAHPDDREAGLKSIMESAQNNSSWHYELRFRMPDGEWRWFEALSVPARQEGDQVEWFGHFTEIQGHKDLEQALREREEQYRLIVENANDIIYTLTPGGLFLYVSPNWKAMMGHDPDSLVGRSFEPFVHKEDVQQCHDFLRRVVATGEPQSGVEFRAYRMDGTFRWFTSNAAPILDERGNVSAYLGIARDITNKKQRDENADFQFRFQHLIAEISSDLVNFPFGSADPKLDYILRRIGEFFQLDRTYLFLLADEGRHMRNAHEWCAEGVNSVITDMADVSVMQMEWSYHQISAMREKGQILLVDDVDALPEPQASNEKVLLKGQGVRSMFCVPVATQGEVIGFWGADSLIQREWPREYSNLLIVVANLISGVLDRSRLEEDLVNLSVTDPLSGVYNRRYTMERLEERLDEARRGGRNIAVAMVDIDHFKRLNDSHGHIAGDGVLREFSAILCENVRSFDVVGRFGGEEFLIVFADASLKAAASVTERILERVRSTAFQGPNGELHMTASAGIASSEELDPGSLQVDSLVGLADDRLYKAKRAGRDCLVAE